MNGEKISFFFLKKKKKLIQNTPELFNNTHELSNVAKYPNLSKKSPKYVTISIWTKTVIYSPNFVTHFNNTPKLSKVALKPFSF